MRICLRKPLSLFSSSERGWRRCRTTGADDADLPHLPAVLHGKIVTVDEKFCTVAGAWAVKGDRILAVGHCECRHPETGRAEKTEKVDLAGKTLLPGLADSHVHPTAASVYEFDHPVPEMDTIADVLKYIGSRAAAVEKGKWIVVRQVFITRLRDQRYPTRQELDLVAPDHPVLFSTGPDASVNSLALKLSGIDRDFKITDGGTGYIEHDAATGEPTGILRSCTRIRGRNAEARRALRRPRPKSSTGCNDCWPITTQLASRALPIAMRVMARWRCIKR